MKNVFVLAEHRLGRLRDTTWEALAAGRDLAGKLGAELTCLLLSNDVAAMAEEIAKQCPKVLAVEDAAFEHFNAEAMIPTLSSLIKDQGPFMLVMGNSNSIIDLAPRLSVTLDAALATDCIAFEVENGKPKALRQMYNYKVNALVSFKNADNVVVTLRGGAFAADAAEAAAGAVEKVDSPAPATLRKRFKGYVEAEKG